MILECGIYGKGGEKSYLHQDSSMREGKTKKINAHRSAGGQLSHARSKYEAFFPAKITF